MDQTVQSYPTSSVPKHEASHTRNRFKKWHEHWGLDSSKEHKYLQEIIRNLGLEYGYKADVEAKLDGGGAVDVLLSRDGDQIACEVALNTAVEYELGNITKSLEAGIKTVLVISPKPKHLQAIQARAEAELTLDQLNAVRFVSPELLPELLTAPEQEQTTVRGYKVRVSHKLPNDVELKRKREKVAGILARAK